MNFDPQELFDAMEGIRAAFNRAADADSGTATPLFRQVARTINKVLDEANNPDNADQDPKKAMMKLFPDVMALQFALSRIRAELPRNPAAAATFVTLQEDLKVELEKLKNLVPGVIDALRNLPGFPSLPDFDLGKPKSSEPPKPAPKPAPKKKPKDSDDFTF